MLHVPTPDALAIAVFTAILVIAAGHDAIRFRIPNWASLAIALLYPFHVLTSPTAIEWAFAAGLAVAVLGVGLVLFARGILGGGDVKLLSAAMLWAGSEHGAGFLAVTALAGGAMALLVMLPSTRHVLAHAYDRFGAGGTGNPIANRQLPYGVAIAVGGLAVAVMLARG